MKRLKAFTLIEILLYVGLVSIFSVVIVAFFVVISETNSKYTVAEEVESDGLSILETFDSYLSNGNTLTGLTFGTNSNTITFTSSVASVDPVTFQLSSGNLQIREGAGGNFINLNSNRVSVSNLIFSNFTPNGSLRPIIKYQFTLTSLNTQNISYSKTYYGSITFK